MTEHDKGLGRAKKAMKWIFASYCSLKPLWSGMGEVVPARTSPTLHPPFPPSVLSSSCLKMSQCINCHD